MKIYSINRGWDGGTVIVADSDTQAVKMYRKLYPKLCVESVSKEADEKYIKQLINEEINEERQLIESGEEIHSGLVIDFWGDR